MYVPIVVEYSTHAVWEKGLALLTELQRICTSTATNVIFLAVTIKKLRLQRDECNRKEKNQSGLIYKAINKPHLAWLVIFLGGGVHLLNRFLGHHCCIAPASRLQSQSIFEL